jgi:O-antigen/teichoic acid export membrane protein
MIITVLIAIVFFALLAKAIIETVWGVCLIIFGTACHTLAFVLTMLAKAIRYYENIKKQREPRRLSFGECFTLVNNPNSVEARRIRTSLR